MSRFFINRPVFAWVIGIVIMMMGAISIMQLPISQFPSIAPPEIAITVTYPGASAETVADTVIRPILQDMTGLDGLEYVNSQAQANGSMEIDLTFKQGTDPDIAQVQVQNKLSLAEAVLPTEVTQEGISVVKQSRNFFLIVSLVSTDGSMGQHDLADYIASNLETPLTQITGVGNYTLFGSEYAMRIWVDPDKLYKYGLTIDDVTTAIAAQNIQVSSGELGGLPAVKGQRLDALIVGPTRYTDPQQFNNILLKVETDGSRVLLSDVASVELGAQSYSASALYNNEPASGIGLQLTPGANQLDVEKAVKAELATLQTRFPPGIQMTYPIDSKPYITLSLEDVVQTLAEAIALVFVVMLIFLQNFRATLIPTIAVPIVLLGTFGVLNALGYSINTLTMLAMVLAVGLLVDDAIVVVENVERLMEEKKLSPREAAIASMEEISGALVGIALVLSAVFLPMAFFGGSTGVIYRQFSITIISAMSLSVLVALILTPALCGTILKPRKSDPMVGRSPAAIFNRGFERARKGYGRGVSGMIRRSPITMFVFALIVVGAGYLFTHMPSGFLPNEDQGLLLGQVSMPAGATAEQTGELLHDVTAWTLAHEKGTVQLVFTVNGFNFAGRAQNAGFVAIRMTDWSKRTRPDQTPGAVAMAINRHFFGNRDGQVFILEPPAVLELGNASGFDFELQDAGNLGHDALYAARNQLLGMAAKDPLLMATRPNGLNDAPQYQLDIDREKASAYGVTIAAINDTIQGALASDYVNQFMRGGRVKQVYVQGIDSARMLPSDIGKWYVNNATGGMVPLSTFVTGHWVTGPQKVEIYNGLTSFEFQGAPAPGVSSGAAMAEITKLVAKLPKGISFQWTGLSYEQVQAGSQTGPLYAISVLVVLLCLAALYESWPVPFAVMLVVPLGLIGTMAATALRGLDNDVYFQVGMLTTVGLAVKNAILIVEFAKHFYDSGMSLVESALEAARERLRPILMTSIAFICGTFPLAIATGAGASSRIAIGTAVVGGMLSATILAIFFVPVFFVTVLGLFRVKPRPIEGKHHTTPAKEH
ncbi:efflux RND transporter permease subunit [Acidisoma cellulosilytica]|uniref:Efflux pump membrane transporter n=1 Tax=Acidisoma cellulosilyticum TaxID=2802395 RepID=A0A964E2P7_9PROT|nr:efflux RND transporter permease subunit [Acidisoma cellulosilyticum]MCB8879539.1 efflux RND transporter permease subunit [Acidisoma cellulosilyticum]